MGRDFQFLDPATWRKGDRIAFAISLVGIIGLCAVARAIVG